MKLAEALMRRKDLVESMEHLRRELGENAAVPEGEEPEQSPETLRGRLSEAISEYEGLVLRINRTNLGERVARGLTIQEAIIRRDALAREWKALATLREQSKPRRDRRRFGWREDEEEKLVSTVDRLEAKERLDAISAERRRLDVELQEANWKVEVYE